MSAEDSAAEQTSDFVDANRANWDDRVDGHLIAYDVAGFAADPDRLSTVVRDDARSMAPHLPGGTVDGLTLAHLQCHIGTDTLSWARLGASVTGIDFSAASIAAARDLATASGLADRATFVQSTVDDAPSVVHDRFDVVYTSIGALVWLPDLAAWARTIRTLLKPGGLFYVRDSHPMLMTIDDRRDDQLIVHYPYFHQERPFEDVAETSYAGDATLDHTRTFFWAHPLSEILGVLLAEGLTIEAFDEQDVLQWNLLPAQMEQTADGEFVLREGRERIPMTFSLAARG